MGATTAAATSEDEIVSRRKSHSILPGFGLTLGFTVLYLSLIVLIPLAAAFFQAAHLTWPQFRALFTDREVLAAFRLTFSAAAIAALVNTVFGLLTAWVLVRYRFPGRALLDAMVDLPFALPTAVAGIALTEIYAPTGWIGALLVRFGVQVAYTPLGVGVALTFVGLPFVVRTLQPVLEDLDRETEEAAASLGADRRQTFVHVILPALLPSLFTGASLAFARVLGEYGSVIFISGNMPMKTEIVPLLIVNELGQFNYPAATALAAAMLVLSFALLLGINLLQKWVGGREPVR